MAGRSTVKAKVVLLGEGAVGKTSIVLRYVENKFNDKHLQTLQVSSLSSQKAVDGVLEHQRLAFVSLFFRHPFFRRNSMLVTGG